MNTADKHCREGHDNRWVVPMEPLIDSRQPVAAVLIRLDVDTLTFVERTR
jgi:hypothetical protein